jgi:hypothetical protein
MVANLCKIQWNTRLSHACYNNDEATSQPCTFSERDHGERTDCALMDYERFRSLKRETSPLVFSQPAW